MGLWIRYQNYSFTSPQVISPEAYILIKENFEEYFAAINEESSRQLSYHSKTAFIWAGVGAIIFLSYLIIVNYELDYIVNDWIGFLAFILFVLSLTSIIGSIVSLISLMAMVSERNGFYKRLKSVVDVSKDYDSFKDGYQIWMDKKRDKTEDIARGFTISTLNKISSTKPSGENVKS